VTPRIKAPNRHECEKHQGSFAAPTNPVGSRRLDLEELDSRRLRSGDGGNQRRDAGGTAECVSFLVFF